MTYTIKFADNKELTDLTLNGNNFVSKCEVKTSDISEDGLKELTITDSDGHISKMENCELVQIVHYDDGYYIVFRTKNEAEIKEEKTQSALAELTEMLSALMMN